MATFFSFGLFHLGKFETTDEHLWKYERIGQYWQALAEQDWEKTYINDKPGVTVALISGIGLLREPHPEDSVHRPQPAGDSRLFEAYQSDQSERVNVIFRLPILVFSALSIPVFFLSHSPGFRFAPHGHLRDGFHRHQSHSHRHGANREPR
jgi:hypothetical protein